jgi:hypothetical protein
VLEGRLPVSALHTWFAVVTDPSCCNRVPTMMSGILVGGGRTTSGGPSAGRASYRRSGC